MTPSRFLSAEVGGAAAGPAYSPDERIGWHLRRAGELALRRLGFTDGLLREALVAGIGGGAVIAVWFLLLDTLQGRPLWTPLVLGSALFHRPEVAPLADLALSFLMILVYTLVHGLAFIAIGGLAARLFVEAERHPAWLFGLLLFFVFFCAGFVTLVAAAASPVLGHLSPLAVLAGNLLAAGFMLRYLWRRHPLDLKQVL